MFDIDHTLFALGQTAEHAAELARPYLHELLAGIYEHYDIVIWSATGAGAVKRKMEVGPMVLWLCCIGNTARRIIRFSNGLSYCNLPGFLLDFICSLHKVARYALSRQSHTLKRHTVDGTSRKPAGFWIC